MQYRAQMNQLANANNRFQTEAKRVLCVCSAGLLRSPTLANTLHRVYGFNTRAAGANLSYALIPVTQALVYWADEIVFVDENARIELCEEAKDDIAMTGKKCVVLNIPDQHSWNDKELVLACEKQYGDILEDKDKKL